MKTVSKYLIWGWNMRGRKIWSKTGWTSTQNAPKPVSHAEAKLGLERARTAFPKEKYKIVRAGSRP